MALNPSPGLPGRPVVALAPAEVPTIDWSSIFASARALERKANRAFLALSPLEQAGITIATTATGTATLLYGHKRFWRRIKNADHVTPSMMTGKKWIKGRVTSVGDSDNFRLYHTPGIFFDWPLKIRFIPKDKKALQNETIHIRIAGVDAPEAAHFGRPAQPFSAEALEYLRSKILGRKIKVLLSTRDQYGRIVGLPLLPRRFLPFLPAEVLPISMLRAGFGEVYTSSGAEYSYIGLDKFKAAEAEAKRKKRGIWSLGKKLELAADYKRRMRDGPPNAKETRRHTGGKGWFGKLFSRS